MTKMIENTSLTEAWTDQMLTEHLAVEGRFGEFDAGQPNFMAEFNTATNEWYVYDLRNRTIDDVEVAPAEEMGKVIAVNWNLEEAAERQSVQKKYTQPELVADFS
jgi:hypothetical protein